MLLELNASLMRYGQGGFGLDAENGRLIRHCSWSLATLEASALLQQMRAIGKEASAWINASFEEKGGALMNELLELNTFKVGMHGPHTTVIWG